MNDAAGGLIETATYCSVGDLKRPGLVGLPDFSTTQVCDDDLTKGAAEVTDAVPTNWYARVMFDELLDPNVETLTPNLDPNTMQPDGTYTGSLQTTQPVTLTCAGIAVPYDGYYSPSGNNVTWPVGPSLLIKPNDPTVVATGSECEISLKSNITAKDGQPVTTGQTGPYKFKLAPLTLLSTSPTIQGDAMTAPLCPPPPPATPPITDPMCDLITPDAPIVLTFNAAMDAASLTTGEVKLFTAADCKPGTTRTPRTSSVVADPADPMSIDILDGAPPTMALAFEPSKVYILEFNNAVVADVAGGTLALPGPGSAADQFTLCFATDVAP